MRDDFGRYNLNADVTRYFNWRGSHTLKGGFQYRAPHQRRAVGRPGSDRRAGLGHDLFDRRRPQRARHLRLLHRRRAPYTQGNVKADNVGLFLQDAWTVNGRLTVNLGLRAENEDVPSFRPENPSMHFGFADKIAPRAGFAWDMKGDSRWKMYSSYGVFYDLLKLTIGRVMFGADRWVNYYYTLDTGNWPSIACDGPQGSGCPGTFIALFDIRSVANLPTTTWSIPTCTRRRPQEFTFGMDHELNKTMSVGTRYVHKWAPWVIEAVCQFVPTGEDCGVNNPGDGTIGKYPFGTAFPAQPRPVRDYDGLEFRLKKRYANRWSLDASYLLSRIWGNWSGVASSDEAVNCLQPNSCLAFNFLYYSFDASGRPSYGVQGTDRPNQFKVAGHLRSALGHAARRQLPDRRAAFRSRRSSRSAPTAPTSSPYGRGDLGRTPVFSQTDLLVQQQFQLPEGSGRRWPPTSSTCSTRRRSRSL